MAQPKAVIQLVPPINRHKPWRQVNKPFQWTPLSPSVFKNHIYILKYGICFRAEKSFNLKVKCFVHSFQAPVCCSQINIPYVISWLKKSNYINTGIPRNKSQQESWDPQQRESADPVSLEAALQHQKSHVHLQLITRSFVLVARFSRFLTHTITPLLLGSGIKSPVASAGRDYFTTECQVCISGKLPSNWLLSQPPELHRLF